MTAITAHLAHFQSLGGILFDRVVLGVCIIIGGLMTLAYSGILPDLALVVGIPALVASMIVDTFLYNNFRIEIGTAVWALIAVFVYLQSVAIGLLYRWVQSQI